MKFQIIPSVFAVGDSGASQAIEAANPVPAGLRTLGGIINTVMSTVIVVGGLILLVMIIYGGFIMLTSVDNPEKSATGKKILTTAFAGFFILFAAYWIAQALEVILGIPLLGE